MLFPQVDQKLPFMEELTLVDTLHAKGFEMPVGLWVFMACRAGCCPFYIKLSP